MGALTDAVTTQVKQHHSLLVKAFGLAGVTAGIALGAMGLATNPQSTVEPKASSGDAPTNTVYVSPTLGGMTLGATQTWAAPDTTEPTMHAVPPVKAPPYA